MGSKERYLISSLAIYTRLFECALKSHKHGPRYEGQGWNPAWPRISWMTISFLQILFLETLFQSTTYRPNVYRKVLLPPDDLSQHSSCQSESFVWVYALIDLHCPRVVSRSRSSLAPPIAQSDHLNPKPSHVQLLPASPVYQAYPCLSISYGAQPV